LLAIKDVPTVMLNGCAATALSLGLREKDNPKPVLLVLLWFKGRFVDVLNQFVCSIQTPDIWPLKWRNLIAKMLTRQQEIGWLDLAEFHVLTVVRNHHQRILSHEAIIFWQYP
jgi:hypothetical protein